MRKTPGIVGGVGYQATLEYYSRIMAKYHDRFGDMNYPELVLFSLSHQKFRSYENAHSLDEYTAYIMYGIERVIAAGADFIALAANSPHAVLDNLRERIDLPILSAVESALREARRQGLHKALLLGIRFTMQSTFYQERFARDGIELIAPSLPDQDIVHDVIYGELLKGVVLESSRDKLMSLIDGYAVDGVVLGCMKLPTILRKGEMSMPVVDTLDAHTTEIVDYACDVASL